jgi:uncharacterized linocin/CFP29 family protein
MAEVTITQGADLADFITNSWRPYGFDKRGRPVNERGRLAVNERALATNAFLNREEWEQLDKTVFEMAKLRLGAYQDLISAGLRRKSSLAAWYSKWRVASERVAADVTMDFRTRLNEDRTDKKTYGVPIPIISAKYSLGRRELLSARAAGQSIETFEAGEASAAVTEKAEDILINGDTSIVVSGSSIPGYRTLSARETGAASSYGSGGDFATISNVTKTFLGVLAAMAAKRYYGPFGCYIHNTQYHEMLATYTDGSGQTALERVEKYPQIKFVKPNDLMTTAGDLLMVQLTRNVVDVEVALTLENRRWEAPDGSAMFFVVMMSAVPRLKTDYQGNAGIAHVTGC